MNIEKYLDVINACRFCFMCRHLSPLAIVSGKESDTPRGHALIADLVRMNHENIKNADFVESIYQADLSAACRTHCVSHYDEANLLLALRRDIVEAGAEPQAVKAFAEQLKNVSFNLYGTGSFLYYNHPLIQLHCPEIADAFNKIAPEHLVISGGDCGKALQILGYEKESQEVASLFVRAVKQAKCDTLVIPHPAVYDFIKANNLLPDMKVLTTAEYLLTLDLPSKNGTVSFIDSDFLKNYQKNNAPRRLLEKLGYTIKEFGITEEESYACGEGAMAMLQLYPENVAKLVARVAAFAERYDAGTIVTASPYTKVAIKTYAPQLKVLSLEEAVLEA
ncbi:MAG: (Fe-S)-binding protein [Victivallales bacterium]|nr:(Fe-S)-binding protein [Victivallales bacterium]